MIDHIERALRRLGLLPKFDEDDMINASIEDKIRDHDSVVDRVHHAMSRRLQSNEALRQSIRIAKRQTNSFADFEKLAIGREKRK